MTAGRVGARSSLTRFAWLSIATAVATMGLKTAAWWITGSVGLLSDALESLVNLAAAVMALVVLAVAGRAPDDSHPHGHEKAEFFSCGAEGALILVAAVSIAVPACQRLVAPRPVEEVGLGLGVAVAASLLNLGVATILGRAGRRYDSVVLEADSAHLMTDVWTSAGVVCGVAGVAWTGWLILDPLIALAVAANIVLIGIALVRRSLWGLMDPAFPPDEREQVELAIRRILPEEARYHALLTRQAGSRRFVSVHILVPGEWTVLRGHQLAREIERGLRRSLHGVVPFTHLEPVEEPSSYEDPLQTVEESE